MASKAKSVELDLSSSINAKLWLTTFKTKARCKKWTDINAVEADGDVVAVEADFQITDNFISACGLRALELISSIVSPSKIDEMMFVDICAAIERFLEPRVPLIVAESQIF